MYNADKFTLAEEEYLTLLQSVGKTNEEIADILDKTTKQIAIRVKALKELEEEKPEVPDPDKLPCLNCNSLVQVTPFFKQYCYRLRLPWSLCVECKEVLNQVAKDREKELLLQVATGGISQSETDYD